jgi:hypothetical protein
MAGGAVPDPGEPVIIQGDPDEVVHTLVTEAVEEPDPDAIEPVLDQ